MAPQDVINFHVAAAQSHLLIAKNWLAAADQMEGAQGERPNAVRVAAFREAAKAAHALSAMHVAMAEAITVREDPFGWRDILTDLVSDQVISPEVIDRQMRDIAEAYQ